MSTTAIPKRSWSGWTSVNDDDQVVLCTDILGGSVNQLALPYLSRPNTYLFTGMNFPMLLQLTCLDENATEAEIKALADVGREAVICMNDYEFPQYDDEDE
ncbi:MAG: PTS sugar transporter subunit IIA [Holdemania filiformis]